VPGATGESASRAHGRSSHIKRHRFYRAVGSGHAPSRCLGVVFRYADPTHAALPGRFCPPSLGVFLARRRSWDVLPFAGLLPRTDEAAFLRLRAHVSFAPRFRPDWFSSGARSRTEVQNLVRLRGVDFWALLPSAIRSPASVADRSILPWALPLAGLRTRCCACAWARPQSHHQPPESSAPPNGEPRIPIRSWVLSKTLQRIDGADALTGLNGFEDRLAAGRPV